MTEIERVKVLKAIVKELKKYHISGIAFDTGLTYPTIRDIKNQDTKRPSESTIETLAKYFDIEVV